MSLNLQKNLKVMRTKAVIITTNDLFLINVKK